MAVWASRVLILILILAGTPQAVTPIQETDALHYVIAINSIPEENKILGTTDVTIKTSEEKVFFELDEELTLLNIEIDKKQASYSRNGKDIFVSVEEQKTSPMTFHFEYAGELVETINNHSWAYTADDNVYAVYEASWYPHLKKDRATAEILLKIPEDWIGVSNGEFVSFDDDSNTYRWIVTSPELGFSFSTGKYRIQQRHLGHVSIECYLFWASAKCIPSLHDTLNFFSDTFTPYPYPKLAVAEVKGDLNGGHGDNSFIILSTEIFRGPNYQEFLAHEVSHNWFGGYVTANDTRWLTEGFATYAGVMYLESIDNELAAKSLKAKREEYIDNRNGIGDKPILEAADEYDEVFHATVYSKGAYVLHMLRFVVGDDTFKEIIKTYLEKHGGGSAGLSDFKEVAQNVSKTELDWFFDEWLETTKFPDFSLESVDVEKQDEIYTVSAVIAQGEDIVKMPVDVFVITQNGEKKKRVWVESDATEFEIITESEPIFLEIDKQGWLLERNRLNNKHVIKYPMNSFGLRMFFSKIAQIFRELF